MKNQEGQSLFEVVLSLAVITVVIVALIILAYNSIRNANYSRNQTVATRHSQEAIEWLRGERDTDYDLFQLRALTSDTYCFPSLSWTSAKIGGCADNDVIDGTILKREIFFTIIGLTNIEVQVTVYWDDAQGLHEVRAITNYTDWRAQ